MTAAAAPRPSTFQVWKLATRLPTLTAAVAPVAVGTGVAIHLDAFDLLPALAALTGAILLQVGANFANDVFDFKKGADTSERLGPPRATQMGFVSPRQMLMGMWLTFALAMAVGAYLVYVGGWPIVAVGLASIAAAIIYTGGPWPIGYHALGDVFVFVFFGLVAVVGTYYVQAGNVPALAVAAAVPVGCTVTQILVVNNLRDIPTDRRTGKTTLGVILGDRGTRAWFVVLLAVALAVPIAISLFSSAEWAWAAAPASLAWAAGPFRAIVGGAEGASLNPVLKATARFNLMLGLLLAVAIAVSSH
jgi:1,4-dihydroxy-2-naphthoate octaprenyltransferase